MSGSSPLNIHQIDTMTLAFKSKRDAAAFLLSCGCGLRAGTLCALSISDVLDTQHRLTGRVTIPRKKMKGRRTPHTVEIPKRALRALAEWIAIHPSPHRAAPLFPSYQNPNSPITTRHWRRLFTGALTAAGIEAHISSHGARKFYAQAIYASTNKDIELTTRALGNKSPIATMHYLDFGQQRINAATLEIFDNAATPPLPALDTEHPTSSKSMI